MRRRGELHTSDQPRRVRVRPDVPGIEEAPALVHVQSLAGNRAAAQLARIVPAPTLLTVPVIQRDESMRLKPLIEDIIRRTSRSRTDKVLGFLTRWGTNASPFTIVSYYLRLNWPGLKYWGNVRRAAARGEALLAHLDGLEGGAQALRRAVDLQREAWLQLPAYPLRHAEQAGRALVTPAELDHVERYFNTAARIANDAMATAAYVRRAIAGWDGVLEEARATKDFTRKQTWEAITLLQMRFGGAGGFRRHLHDTLERAEQIERACRSRQYIAADILGRWTPEGYQPPPYTH